MKIINALLFPTLYLLSMTPVPAAEFTVSGMINQTTCAIDNSTDNTIELLDGKIDYLEIYNTTLTITVSCADPDADVAFEGRFTTMGEVDPTTLAIKNFLTPEAGGAKDIGIQIIDTASRTVIEPNAPESQEPVATVTVDKGTASFQFDIGYVNLGAPSEGDVRVEATFVVTYL